VRKDGHGPLEKSGAKPGGMDDRVELYSSEGVILCDLLHGSVFQTHSKTGCDYAEGRQAAR
jgi:hypothetical protein